MSYDISVIYISNYIEYTKNTKYIHKSVYLFGILG